MRYISKLHFTYTLISLAVYIIAMLIYWLVFLHRDCSELWDLKTLHLLTAALLFTSLVGYIDDKILGLRIGLGLTRWARLWKYDAKGSMSAEEVKNRAEDEIWVGHKRLEMPLTGASLIASIVNVVT